MIVKKNCRGIKNEENGNKNMVEGNMLEFNDVNTDVESFFEKISCIEESSNCEINSWSTKLNDRNKSIKQETISEDDKTLKNMWRKDPIIHYDSISNTKTIRSNNEFRIRIKLSSNFYKKVFIEKSASRLCVYCQEERVGNYIIKKIPILENCLNINTYDYKNGLKESEIKINKKNNKCTNDTKKLKPKIIDIQKQSKAKEHNIKGSDKKNNDIRKKIKNTISSEKNEMKKDSDQLKSNSRETTCIDKNDFFDNLKNTSDKLKNTSDNLENTSDNLENTSNEIENTSDKLDNTPNKQQNTSDKLENTSNEIENDSDKLENDSDKLDNTPNKQQNNIDNLENCSNKNKEVSNSLKPIYDFLYIKPSSIHGYGLFTEIDIDENVFLMQYIGVIIGKCMSDKQEKKYIENGIKSIYMFEVDNDIVIDATIMGNKARYINHSCNPNCVSITDLKKKTILYYTLRKIYKDEELTIDYNFKDINENEKCNCGNINCKFPA